MPILGVVRARDFDDAVEQAVWLEHGNRHSAHIHSKNIDNITKYAKAIDTADICRCIDTDHGKKCSSSRPTHLRFCFPPARTTSVSLSCSSLDAR